METYHEVHLHVGQVTKRFELGTGDITIEPVDTPSMPYVMHMTDYRKTSGPNTVYSFVSIEQIKELHRQLGVLLESENV